VTITTETPWAKQCEPGLQLEPAMWLFITVEGVEPTNNAAERAIVLPCCGDAPVSVLRAAGSVFVARMLTVVTTLHSQNRNVLSI